MLLGNRSYDLLLTGQTVSQLGNAFYPLAVYWLTFSLTHSRAELGFLGTVTSLTGIAGMFAGVYVDRWDRRWTMIWADVGRMVLTGLLAAIAAGRGLSPAVVFAFALALGLLANLFSPAQASLLPKIVAGDDLGPAISLNQAAGAGAGLVGTALGGMLLGLFGPALLLLLDAASFAFSWVTVGLLRLPQSATHPRPPQANAAQASRSAGYLPELREGLGYLWRHPLFRRLLPISMILNFSFMPLNVLDVVWVRQVLRLGAFAYGLFGAFTVAGVILGSVLIRPLTRRLSPWWVLSGTLLLLAGSYIAFSRLPCLVPDLGLMLCLGLAMGVANPMVQALFQQAVPSELMGRATGAMSSLVLSAAPLGAMLAGLGASVAPLSVVFLVGGCLVLTTLPLAFGLARSADKSPPQGVAG